MVVTLEALRFEDIFKQPPAYAQNSKWADLTNNTYTQIWSKQPNWGYQDYPEMKDTFRLIQAPNGKYLLQFNNDNIVYQKNAGGGAPTKYRLFFRVYDSSTDASGVAVGWGRNRKGFERLSIDVLVTN